MRAATIVDGRLELREHQVPEPGLGEVLVRVSAASVNAADLVQLAGGYPAPPGSPPDIPGLDLAGTVERVGPGARRYSPGDRVMAVVGGGAMAEYCAVHESHLLPVPDEMSWPEAGGFAEAVTTAHDAILTQGRLAPGERLLVNGAAGGVGLAAVQLALAAGAEVVASVRDAGNRERLRAAIARHDESALTLIDAGAAAGIDPVDVVLELVGGPNLATDLDRLRPRGRIVVIGTSAGRVAELDLLALMQRRGQIMASTLRFRSLADKADAARRVEASALPLWRRGLLRIPVHSTHPLAGAAAALEQFASGGKLGKIVLLCD